MMDQRVVEPNKMNLFFQNCNLVSNNKTRNLLMSCVLHFREKYGMLFDEPVLIQANFWYVAWARISGPSSDCGANGLGTIHTEDT